MQRGTKKPARLKLVEGDTRKVGPKAFAAEVAAMKRGPVGEIKPPAGVLDRYGRKHFRDVVKALEQMDELSSADEGSILAAALGYQMMAAASRAKNVNALCNATKHYIAAADRLGLSPVARTKLTNRTERKPEAAIESKIA